MILIGFFNISHFINLFIDSMKTILFKKNAGLYLRDRFTKKEKKVSSIINYLDCPVQVEEGISFGTFFGHLVKEKEILNMIFKETMEKSSIDNFLEEWQSKCLTTPKVKGIKYINAYKVFDYIELPKQENFVDIRIELDGVGEEEELYNLEFIPINELKDVPFLLSNNVSIYKTLPHIKGEEIFFKGQSFITLFELIGTILYILTIHGSPAARQSAKNKFIKILGETNIIELLEKEKEDSVDEENYEEASHLKKILDRLKNGFIQ